MYFRYSCKDSKILVLTLVMLNKLRCHAHFQFSANQITWSRLLIQIHIHNGKQCRSRSVGFFTVCKCRVYPGSAEQGLNTVSMLFLFKKLHQVFHFQRFRPEHLYLPDSYTRSYTYEPASMTKMLKLLRLYRAGRRQECKGQRKDTCVWSITLNSLSSGPSRNSGDKSIPLVYGYNLWKSPR